MGLKEFFGSIVIILLIGGVLWLLSDRYPRLAANLTWFLMFGVPACIFAYILFK